MTDKPSLIKVSTLIGYGSPNKADSHDVHGAPLGAAETAATREALNWPYGEFEVPKEAYAEFAKSAERGAAAHKAWDAVAAAYAQKYPEEWAEFESIATGKLPANWAEKLPKFTSAGEARRGTRGQRQRLAGPPAAVAQRPPPPVLTPWLTR